MCWRQAPQLQLAVYSLAIKGKANRLCCCLLVLLDSLVRCRVSTFFVRPKRHRWSVRSSTIILSFWWFYPDQVFLPSHLFSQFVFLTMSCWYPVIKETVCSEERWVRKLQPKQIITSARAKGLQLEIHWCSFSVPIQLWYLNWDICWYWYRYRYQSSFFWILLFVSLQVVRSWIRPILLWSPYMQDKGNLAWVLRRCRIYLLKVA